MTAPHRRFSVKPPDERVAPTFILDGPGWSEDFTCASAIPGAVLLQLGADIAEPARQARAVLDFLDACLADDDGTRKVASSLDRFRVLVRDRRRNVDLDTLVGVAEYLGEVFAERPTEPPAP